MSSECMKTDQTTPDQTRPDQTATAPTTYLKQNRKS